jgi:hypothetical protein
MKETTSDTLAPFARQDGQNQPKWFNMTALANNDLSIKSDDLSIKSEKAMREVQRLGQEIEQEPVAWYRDEDGIRIYYETKVWNDCTPLYTHPQPEQDEVDIRSRLYQRIHELEELLRDFAKAIEAKLKEKNT